VVRLLRRAERRRFVDAAYFSTVTLSTTGYGDILPLTGVARALVAVEILIGFGLLGFLLSRVTGYVSSASDRDEAGESPDVTNGSDNGGILVLRDTDGDGKANRKERFGTLGGSRAQAQEHHLQLDSQVRQYRFQLQAGEHDRLLARAVDHPDQDHSGESQNGAVL
jgi:hypothetical protein